MIELIKQWHRLEPGRVKLRTSYDEQKYVLHPSGRYLAVNGEVFAEDVLFAVMECLEEKKYVFSVIHENPGCGDDSYLAVVNEDDRHSPTAYGLSPGKAFLKAYLAYMQRESEATG